MLFILDLLWLKMLMVKELLETWQPATLWVAMLVSADHQQPYLCMVHIDYTKTQKLSSCLFHLTFPLLFVHLKFMAFIIPWLVSVIRGAHGYKDAAADNVHHSYLCWVMVSRSCMGWLVHSFMFVSHFFLWPPWHQSPCKVPWKTVFNKVSFQVIWLNQTSLLYLTVISAGSWCHECGNCSLYKVFGLVFSVWVLKQPSQAEILILNCFDSLLSISKQSPCFTSKKQDWY